jgi:hypothetical protein
MHSVYVEYDGGMNAATDEAIYAAVGYVFDGPIKCDSGCMMGGARTRDLVFRFEDGEQAAEAAKKLRELSDVRVNTAMVA